MGHTPSKTCLRMRLYAYVHMRVRMWLRGYKDVGMSRLLCMDIGSHHPWCPQRRRSYMRGSPHGPYAYMSVGISVSTPMHMLVHMCLYTAMYQRVRMWPHWYMHVG